MIELDRSVEQQYGAKLKIVGVGGGGGNAINSMMERGLEGCEFMAVNTDAQALVNNLAPIKVQVGKQSTRGLGAGANPEIGRESTMEDREELEQALSGADMVFVTAGMGGGTGTGGAPVVAEVAHSLGALVVGIVTRPFDWEGKPRREKAEVGIRELRQHVDTLIVIPNQKLLSIIDKKTGFREAFQQVDDVLYNATRGIAEIITGHGFINVDFADVRTVMKDMGDALMGTGIAEGEYRATEAAQNAISSPLLEGLSIAGSQGVLVNIAASSDLTMMEVNEAVNVVHEAVGSDANLIFGVVLNDDLGEAMMVTVIATGFNMAQREQPKATAISAGPKAFKAPAAEQQRAESQRPTEGGDSDVRPIAPRRESTNVRVPVGQEELEKYNEPAYLRRGGIHRGGYDIVRRDEDESKGGHENEEREEAPQQQEPRRMAEKPAFLRRIMD